ncbi:MAG TPA: hypothetical protein VNM14_20795 [Planctomycetota bacterium]|jgi:hypothetical protein|nr:hypothetical protein [Planctomycetota bacterium]
MALPPKKPQTGRVPPGKPPAAPPPKAKAGPPTRRGGAAPASGRASAPAPKNNLPLILGIAGGVVVLLIIAVVVMTGGEDHKPEKVGKSKEPKVETAKKAPPPDVSALEATGKSKCEEGVRIIQPRLNPDPSSPKDRVFNDLEAGLKLLKEGLEAYKKATDLAGKKYPLDDYRKTQDRAIKIFCTELESEGLKACDAGLKIIKSTESRIVDTNKLNDQERAQLYQELKKGSDLIASGMGLFSRSEAVSGHQFDVTPYQEARKVARMKLPELKPN